jgi:EmrB/QacA subfamily drug resistance transporter
MNKAGRRKTLLMLISVGLGTFMSALDSSVVNVAVPVIENHFKVSMAEVEWVITAYLMVISSVLLFFGRLSDLYGHKKVYLTGFAIFTAGSGLCSLSSSIGMLIGCRIFQAAGASMMFAANSAIVTHNVDPKHRGKAFSVIAISVAAALSTGPVLGGALAGSLGWQSIFYINIPIGIVGIILAVKNIPADQKSKKLPLDIPGSVMVFVALFLILLPLDQVASGMNIIVFAVMLFLGIALTAVFIRFERKTKHPMLNLNLFKNRVFSAGLSAAVLNFMAQYIMTFLSPFYLQTVRMLSPAMTGLLFIPMPLTMLLVAPLSGYVSDRFDTRYISSAGMGIMGAGLFMLSFLNVDTPYWYIVIAMMVSGLGCGLFQTPNNSAVMGNVPAQNRGIASGMLATSRNIGMVLGVALSGALFSILSNRANALFTTEGVQGSALQQSAFIYALHYTYLAAVALAILAMVASLTKGRVLTGREMEKQGNGGE